MFLRLKTIPGHAASASLALFFGAVCGCGPTPAPQFTLAPKTQQLAAEARDGATVKGEDGTETHVPGVTELVEAKFGTLPEPAVWPLLPVDFGGIPAKVAQVVAPTAEAAAKAAEEEQPLDEVVLTVAGDGKSAPALNAGSQVAWAPSSAYEGQAHRVKAFDAKTGRITLAGPFATGLPAEGDELLLNPGPTLEKGQTLYARHCLHCHGAAGAGDGPTAKYLDPKPRDYRLGIYKFTSTGATEKASREDLAEVLRRGIPGTSMPAFRLLERDDPNALHALVEYVRWLSMHGEYENQLAVIPLTEDYTEKGVAQRVADGEKREEIAAEVKDFLAEVLAEEAPALGEDLAASWTSADTPEAVVTPASKRVPDTPESRERGRLLYLSDRTKCASCHGPYGRGDGPQAEAFQNNPATNEPYPRPGLHDAWDNPLKPRDLTQGVFRGGRRPIDLYRRIYAGIKGTPMPTFGASLKEEEIWDLVNFVLHAPYDSLPDAGKGKSLVSSSAH